MFLENSSADFRNQKFKEEQYRRYNEDIVIEIPTDKLEEEIVKTNFPWTMLTEFNLQWVEGSPVSEMRWSEAMDDHCLGSIFSDNAQGENLRICSYLNFVQQEKQHQETFD